MRGEKLDVEDRLSLVLSDHHILHVVEDHLGRIHTQIPKDVLVAVQKYLQRAAADELNINRPTTVAPDHQEELKGNVAVCSSGWVSERLYAASVILSI